MSPEKLTAHEIALTFMNDRHQRNLCIQHYTPHKWFECDVCEITESHFMREYEIKVSRSDFFADTRKARNTEYIREERAWKSESKHQMLAAGHERGPANFTFIVPAGLVTAEEVPEWAGLIEAHWRESSHVIPYRISLKRVKDGRRLHTTKVADEVIKHMRGVCYYRMHNLLIQHARLTAKKDPEKIPAEPTYDFQKPISAEPGTT